ncbi:hypothetical protein K1T35_11355 [Pseudonocardia sp. DSM 110487]|uniref:DUF6416 domain-containing protein n=1 Tax=Pseudonocardia sp. DSM 110487 TaxID=2865833 RepID=UPI001C6958D0|nr:DUF6416 domain-containing protein [Pseudonocardia sp. DSM 110487]QYN37778.1 hypothetical protein K1T35_11355 [Pseudonocardia sp. DSM 110487]
MARTSSLSSDLPEWTAVDGELARSVWDRLSENARSILVILMERPGTEHIGAEIARILKLPYGNQSVHSTLGNPGRLCREAGRTQLWRYRYPTRDRVHYSVTPIVADLLRRAAGSAV